MHHFRSLSRTIVALLLLTTAGSAPAQLPNVPTPTLGGKQFWGDAYIYGGWRIQQNVYTGHHRLLDAKDVRRAWGSYEACAARLEEAKAAGKARLSSTRLCVLVHGYLRSKDSMAPLQEALEAAGYEVYAINYPSTDADIAALSDQVRQVIDRAQCDFEEVNLVTHSLGGLIARRILNSDSPPKIRTLVMLGPPSQGAVLADLLLEWWPSEIVLGPAGKELGKDAKDFAANAGTPPIPFGIIAGGKGDDKGWNPLIPGDDDGVVAVEDTRLEGAAGFVVVRSLHTFMMKNPDLIRQTLAFLEALRFD
jgi:pimeloyl-ACP methyl ester carboxylesterase